MNCKKDEIAYVRSTHPLLYLHGVTVQVKEFFPAIHGYENVWRFEFSGAPQPSDTGDVHAWGYIPDCHLVPISGVPVEDETPIETNVPEAVKLAWGIEAPVLS